MTDRQNMSDHDLLIRIDENIEEVKKCQTDLEVRLRDVEKWKERQIGAGLTGGVAGAGGGVAGGFLAAWLWFSKIFGGS